MPETQVVATAVPEPPPTPPTSSKLLTWLRGRNAFERYGRHVLAWVAWSYFLGQLFVFDFDAWLVSILPPELGWIVVYKLLTFLFCAALILNFVPRRTFWSWALFVALYPVMLAGAAILLLALILLKLKSWTALFAVLNVTLSFFARFKANLLIYVLAAIGAVVALAATRQGNLISAAVILVFAITLLVCRRLISMFRRSPIFNVYVNVMARVMEFSRKNLIKPSKITGVDVTQLTLGELEKRYGQLSTAVFLSELCGFLETKFKAYRSSNVSIATSLLALLGLFVAVTFLLSLANFAVYRAQPHAFHVVRGHDLFDFFYYTFGAVTGQRGDEIVPLSLAAKVLSMYAVGLEFIFIAGTGLSLILSLVKRNEDADIAEAISGLRKERQRMDAFMQEGFALDFSQAIEVLESLKGGLRKIIQMLRAAQDL